MINQLTNQLVEYS